MSEGNIAADQLRLFIERIERLNEEKKSIGDDIKDVYGEAKATGFDVPTMRKIVALRKMEKHVRQEAEALLETYKAALGMDDMFAGHDGSPRDQRAQAAADHLKEAYAPADTAEESDLYARALALVIEHQKASSSWLQRQLRIGYNSAARLIEKMERADVVSGPDGQGKRTVLTRDYAEAAARAVYAIIEPALAEAVH